MYKGLLQFLFLIWSSTFFLTNSVATEQKANVKYYSLSNLDFINEQPPAGLVWFTVFIAATTLIWGVFSYIFDKLHERRLRRQRRIDEYWFRTVVMPMCIQPLENFLTAQAENFKHKNTSTIPNSTAISPRKYSLLLREFKDGKEKIKDRFLLTQVFNEQLYIIVANKLDQLEDEVALHCAYNELGKESNVQENVGDPSYIHSYIYTSLRDIFNQFIKLHQKIP